MYFFFYLNLKKKKTIRIKINYLIKFSLRVFGVISFYNLDQIWENSKVFDINMTLLKGLDFFRTKI